MTKEIPDVIEQDVFGGKEAEPGVVGQKHTCANCNVKGCFVRNMTGIDNDTARAIDLRCDSWGADE